MTESAGTHLDESKKDFLALVEPLIVGWNAETAEMPHALLVQHYTELAQISFHDVTIDGPHGPIPARVYTPVSAPLSTFMWIHGGAFVTGDLNMPEAHWVSLSLAAAGHRIVSVDYHKALGGTHYPVPMDDVHAAWKWVHTQGWNGPLRFGGGSAGGAYAAALSVRLRDEGALQPDAVLLVYPIVHPQLPEMTDEMNAATAGLPVRDSFNPRIIEGMMFNYAGETDALSDPHAFAGVADSTGLPPTFIINSEHDVLRASGERYAHQLKDAGVDVAWVTEMGSDHGQLNRPLDPAGISSLTRIIRWLESLQG
ncbi:Acetyl esterase/lipase [Microbacterium sp. cf046]|uniref:alpha/beta hydrolase fold domain-containing protein n=1 Tax=Microbacterium sp. cf046 TaxID=1761803 RepID=UPI0008E565CC|nr:alpha/beta hydrolase [Microbacterium sp. cf046]SFS16817.1 Acetyl esterase/lipase [Microbacterium sp. cf046]